MCVIIIILIITYIIWVLILMILSHGLLIATWIYYPITKHNSLFVQFVKINNSKNYTIINIEFNIVYLCILWYLRKYTLHILLKSFYIFLEFEYLNQNNIMNLIIYYTYYILTLQRDLCTLMFWQRCIFLKNTSFKIKCYRWPTRPNTALHPMHEIYIHNI